MTGRLLRKIRIVEKVCIRGAVRWNVKIHGLDGECRGPIKPLRLNVGHAIDEEEPVIGQIGLVSWAWAAKVKVNKAPNTAWRSVVFMKAMYRYTFTG